MSHPITQAVHISHLTWIQKTVFPVLFRFRLLNTLIIVNYVTDNLKVRGHIEIGCFFFHIPKEEQETHDRMHFTFWSTAFHVGVFELRNCTSQVQLSNDMKRIRLMSITNCCKKWWQEYLSVDNFIYLICYEVLLTWKWFVFLCDRKMVHLDYL